MSPIFIFGLLFFIYSDNLVRAYPRRIDDKELQQVELSLQESLSNDQNSLSDSVEGGFRTNPKINRFKRQDSSLQQSLQNLQNTQQQQSQAQRRPGSGGFGQNNFGGNQGQGFNNPGGFGNNRPRPGQGGSSFNQGFSNGQSNQNGFSNGGGGFGNGGNAFGNTNQGGLNNGGRNNNQGGLNNGGRNNNQGGGQEWTTVRGTFNIPIDETNIPEAECVRRCQSIASYNPVCGSDNITYTNEQRFRCAQQCGRQVQMVFRGTCVTTQAPRTG